MNLFQKKKKFFIDVVEHFFPDAFSSFIALITIIMHSSTFYYIYDKVIHQLCTILAYFRIKDISIEKK